MLRHPPMSTLSTAAALCLALGASAAAADPWPGGPTVTTVDAQNALGDDVSGLYYQGSGSATPGVLWAVDNGSTLMLRLLWDGAKWVRDPANGWAAGKKLFFPGGGGRPDPEGITMTEAGPAGGVFVSSESDVNVAGSRNSILRYDVSGAAATLTATREWNLTADLPVVAKNAGAESVEWIPDAALVAAGFVDQSTGLPYDPASYPGHGSGLFFVGLEANGSIYAYALNQTSSAFTRVHTFASGVNTFGALHWDANERRLWVVCDNTQNPPPACNGRSRLFKVDRTTGTFALVADYDRPAGMGNFNNEGFTFPTNSECVGGVKPVYWADDGNDDGHVLRSASLPCTPPKNDLLADFGAGGLQQFMNNSAWVQVSPSSPLFIASGDLDDSGKDEAVASFSDGWYTRYDNAGAFVKIYNRPPTRFAAGDIDGAAGEDLVADFGGSGVWARYNNAGLTKLQSASAEDLATGDFDGNGVDDVLGDFRASGLWVRLNNGSFAKIHPTSPRFMAVGDFDGDGKDDAALDFGPDGVWIRYNNAVFTKVRDEASQGLATGDLDGDGRDELLASLAPSGLWTRYNNATWVKSQNSTPVRMTTGDLDGNGKDEAIADFGAKGVFVRYNNGGWTKINAGTTEGLVSGAFD